MFGNCKDCGSGLKILFNLTYCPNNCDKKVKIKKEKLVLPNIFEKIGRYPGKSKKWYTVWILKPGRAWEVDERARGWFMQTAQHSLPGGTTDTSKWKDEVDDYMSRGYTVDIGYRTLDMYFNAHRCVDDNEYIFEPED